LQAALVKMVEKQAHKNKQKTSTQKYPKNVELEIRFLVKGVGDN